MSIDVTRIRPQDRVRAIPPGVWTAVAGLCLAWGAFLSFALGVRAGRDMGTYEEFFSQLLRVHPDNPLVMLFRTPGVPLFFGIQYELWGLPGLTVVLAVAYAGIGLIVFALGSTAGRTAGFTALGLYFLHFAFAQWHFAVGSESVQGIALAGWFALAFATFHSRQPAIWALHGAALVALILVRPSNLPLVAAAAIPLLNRGLSWPRRLILAGCCVAVVASGVVGLSAYNGVRYGDFRLARLGKAHLPFYRLYLQNHEIDPENGPASARLDAIVQSDILNRPVFAEYGIDTREFYQAGTSRMFAHILDAVNTAEGWESDWQLLQDVAMETAARNPIRFLLGYIDQLGEVFYFSDKRFFTLGPLRQTNERYLQIRAAHWQALQEKGLPIPSEDEMIPGVLWQLQPRPEGYAPSSDTLFGTSFTPQPWNVSNGGILYPLPRPAELLSVLLAPNGLYIIVIGVALFATWFGAIRIDLRVPVLAGLAGVCLALTLMASVQREFRYPFDPLFIVLAVHCATPVLQRVHAAFRRRHQ